MHNSNAILHSIRLDYYLGLLCHRARLYSINYHHTMYSVTLCYVKYEPRQQQGLLNSINIETITSSITQTTAIEYHLI